MSELEKNYIDELIRVGSSEKLRDELTKINKVLDSISIDMYRAIGGGNKKGIHTLGEVQERLGGYKKAISVRINEIIGEEEY